VVDWGSGEYERTAVELEPVSRAVVEMAALSPSEDVIDLACGTGNAALLAAGRGARVVGIDSAPRLLEVARDRARAQEASADFRVGDLLALPVADAAADVVLSVFGVVFAPDPAQALREVRRILRPGGRALISAWVPAGPIDAMLGALGRVLARVNPAPPPRRFSWSDDVAVRELGSQAGVSLQRTTRAELAIRDRSPEDYVLAGQSHPMSLAVRPLIERAGAAAEVQAAMTAVLRDANEDPEGFLVHSPYVVHEFRV
jgi:SAM-dependent methyltransferase